MGYQTWYSASKKLEAVAILGEDLYEREIIRFIFCRYARLYGKDYYQHKILVPLSFKDFKNCMSRKRYFTAMERLSQRSVIKYTAVKGPKGYHEVSIITEPIIKAIVAQKCRNWDLLNEDEIFW